MGSTTGETKQKSLWWVPSPGRGSNGDDKHTGGLSRERNHLAPPFYHKLNANSPYRADQVDLRKFSMALKASNCADQYYYIIIYLLQSTRALMVITAIDVTTL